MPLSEHVSSRKVHYGANSKLPPVVYRCRHPRRDCRQLGNSLGRYTFHAFVKDVIPRVEILTLREDKYQAFIKIKQDLLDLDFHDTYQYQVAIEHDLVIVTLNRQFEIAEEIRVLIL